MGTGWMGGWERVGGCDRSEEGKTSWCGRNATGGAVGSGLVVRWDGWGPGMVGKKEGGRVNCQGSARLARCHYCQSQAGECGP